MQAKLTQLQSMLERYPRARLGFFPTPLCRLDRLSRLLGVELYIKRDDFTGISLFGGNKVRKLEYLLGAALRRGAAHAITYGATQSNHAMETAAACRRVGIQPILYLTAVVPPVLEEGLRANLLLDNILGAEIHIVPILPGETEADADARAWQMGCARAAELEASGHPCENIPMGGATPVGSLGFASAVAELASQLEAADMRPFDAIYHATGTGGTMAGLHAGRAILGMQTRIVSVAASPKDESAYIGKVSGMTRDVLALLGGGADLTAEEMHLNLTQWMPGYEQPNPEASEALRLLAREEGLFIDPVYTGKAFAALLADVRSGAIRPGERVLFWHTGGATALFAEPEILGGDFHRLPDA